MTQHNVFIRKFGHMAVVITILDWEMFKELETHSPHESPDFLVGGVTQKSIYTNMLPSMTINTSEVQDITDTTKGAGLDGILTGSSNAGELWAYKKVKNPFNLF